MLEGREGESRRGGGGWGRRGGEGGATIAGTIQTVDPLTVLKYDPTL